MSETHDLCACCGAPRTPGYAACKFCNTVFAREQQTSLQENAVPCPQCRTLNEWGAQRCVQCKAWVVVQCAFCSALSPHHVPACLKCNEAFAGAPERFAQRTAQQTGQQRMAMLGTVGNVAASFLGAAAGVAVSGAWSGDGYRHEGHRAHPHHDSGGFFGSNGDGGSDQSNWGSSDRSGSSDGGGLLGSILGNASSSGDGVGSSESSSSGDGGSLLGDLFSGSSSDDGDDS